MKRSILAVGLLLIALGLNLGGSTSFAQTYPNRPVQLVIPGAAGSILDIAGRLTGDELGKILGTQFIPVVKPGAGFTLGTDFVARSKKDGYTLVYTNSAAIVFTRALNPETVPYDPDRDLEPLGLHLFFPNAIAVQASAPWKNFKELLEYAKKNPDKLRVSTTGIGSTSHFNLEIIQSLTGAQFNHVPFKGGESVITALLGGHVEMTFDAVSKIKPHVESGKMRMLLTTSKIPDLPNVPTITELGYKQELFTAWFGMYGPAGLPEEVERVLIPAVEKAVKNPELRAKVEKLDFVVNYKSPAEQKKLAADEYERTVAIAVKIGLRNK
ncbi:MAG TPA: tripartite tricarboxylate transporter substrate binding protein [Thermodesulfobacteriota bacterium]|nr:tripartite tricarboxylate transporter substrate binding protein [Thermodesulfobacteriota bacterium]